MCILSQNGYGDEEHRCLYGSDIDKIAQRIKVRKPLAKSNLGKRLAISQKPNVYLEPKSLQRQQQGNSHKSPAAGQQSHEPAPRIPHGGDETKPNKLVTLLDLCVSSFCRGHASVFCIVPTLTDDPRRESEYCVKLMYNIYRPFIQDKGRRQCPSSPPETMSATANRRRMRSQGLGMECPHLLQRAMRSGKKHPSNKYTH